MKSMLKAYIKIGASRPKRKKLLLELTVWLNKITGRIPWSKNNQRVA